MSTTFSVTLFDTYAADRKREGSPTLDQLAVRIRRTTAPAKDRLPWLKLARFGNARTPAGSLRHDRNVLACSGIEADYDGERIGFDDAVSGLGKAGLCGVVYTSPSHTETRPRWRVLCPSSREFQPSERNRLLSRVNGLFGGVFARESWTLSQAYYFGSVANNPAHRVAVVDGLCVDHLGELDEIAVGPPGAAPGVIGESGSDARGDAELIRRVLTGEGYHCELTALAARYIGRSLDPKAVSDILRGIMLATPEDARDERWHDRFRTVGGLIASARAKFADIAERRRAVARLTHQMIRAGRSGDEIKGEITAVAERFDLAPDGALAIARRILSEKIRNA